MNARSSTARSTWNAANKTRIRLNTAMKTPVDTEAICVSIRSSAIKRPLRLTRHIPARPFVPANSADRSLRCRKIRAIQASGLAQRLRKIHCQHLVLGISGGLDSTLALIIAVEAFRMNALPSENIIAVTMPGFGTTKRTHANSTSLMDLFHVTCMEVSIHDAVSQHFQDIRHDAEVHDITYENAQARERTQILMDLANQHDAIVLGTGDLSELALGWCTYNGDHMSMYAVNASIPKTLVRYMVESYAEEQRDKRQYGAGRYLDRYLRHPGIARTAAADQRWRDRAEDRGDHRFL